MIYLYETHTTTTPLEIRAIGDEHALAILRLKYGESLSRVVLVYTEDRRTIWSQKRG